MSTSAKTSAKASPHDALAFLTANHKALLAMMRDYERHKASASTVEKGKAALRLCHCLSIHCAIKEEIFHPAVAATLGKKAEPILADIQVYREELRRTLSQGLDPKKVLDTVYNVVKKRQPTYVETFLASGELAGTSLAGRWCDETRFSSRT